MVMDSMLFKEVNTGLKDFFASKIGQFKKVQEAKQEEAENEGEGEEKVEILDEDNGAETPLVNEEEPGQIVSSINAEPEPPVKEKAANPFSALFGGVKKRQAEEKENRIKLPQGVSFSSNDFKIYDQISFPEDIYSYAIYGFFIEDEVDDQLCVINKPELVKKLIISQSDPTVKVTEEDMKCDDELWDWPDLTPQQEDVLDKRRKFRDDIKVNIMYELMFVIILQIFLNLCMV